MKNQKRRIAMLFITITLALIFVITIPFICCVKRISKALNEQSLPSLTSLNSDEIQFALSHNGVEVISDEGLKYTVFVNDLEYQNLQLVSIAITGFGSARLHYVVQVGMADGFYPVYYNIEIKLSKVIRWRISGFESDI